MNFLKITYLSIALIITGCNDSDTSSSSPNDTNAPTGITTKFSVKDTFNQSANRFIVGEEVTLEVELINNSNSEIVYHYTKPAEHIEIVKQDQTIWYTHYGFGFIQVMTQSSLPAGHTARWTHKWIAGNNNDGVNAGLGVYTLKPKLLVSIENVQIPDFAFVDITVQ